MGSTEGEVGETSLPTLSLMPLIVPVRAVWQGAHRSSSFSLWELPRLANRSMCQKPGRKTETVCLT